MDQLSLIIRTLLSQYHVGNATIRFKEYVDLGENGLTGALANGSIDFVPPYLTMSAARSEIVDFVTPCYNREPNAVLVHKSENTDKESIILETFGVAVMLSWVIALLMYSGIAVISEKTRFNNRTGIFAAFSRYSYAFLFEKRMHSIWKSRCHTVLILFWSFLSFYGAIRYIPAEFIHMATPSMSDRAEFSTFHELGILLERCEYSVVAVKGFIQTTRLITDVDPLWEPLRRGLKRCRNGLILAKSNQDALQLVKDTPRSIHIIDATIVYKEVKNSQNGQLFGLLDFHSSPMRYCLALGKNSAFKNDIARISLRIHEHGLAAGINKLYDLPTSFPKLMFGVRSNVRDRLVLWRPKSLHELSTLLKLTLMCYGATLVMFCGELFASQLYVY